MATTTTKPLNCRQVRKVINQFLDGELPATKHHLVVDHLEVCDMCGIEATKVEAVIGGLRALRGPVDADAMSRLDAFAASVAAGEVA